MSIFTHNAAFGRERLPMRLRLATFVLLIVSMAAAVAAQYPPTKQDTVTDIFHGVSVTEHYRWLENFDDPAVKDWMAAQNEFSRTYFSTIESRKTLRAELNRFYSVESSSYYSLKYIKGFLFAIKNQPPKQQPYIVSLTDPNDLTTERVVIDPNVLDTTGQTSMDFYQPSSDAKLVAVSLSYRGSEDGTLFIFDVATGAKLSDSIPRVNFPTAGGSVAWNGDNSGFYYTRYPQKGERADEDLHFYQQVYFHKLGTDFSEDRYEVGKEFPGSLRSNWRPPKMASTFSRPSLTAMVASMSITSSRLTRNGRN